MFHFDETGALGRIVDHLQAARVLATLLRIELKNSMLDEVFDFGLVHEVEDVRWFHEFERDLVFLTLDTATLRCATLCEGEAILHNDVLERGGHDFGTKSKSDVQISATIHIDHSAFTTTFPRSARRTWAHQGAHAAGTPAARVGPIGRLT